MKNFYTLLFLIAFSTSDFAQIWKPVFLPDNNWTHIVGESQGVLFAGRTGAYRTTDGYHFQDMRAGQDPANVSCNSVVSRGTETFGAFTNGIFKSTDAGLSWSLSHNTLFAMSIINHNDTLYCGGIKVFRSTDGGGSWSVILGSTWDDYNYSDRSDNLFIQNEHIYFTYKGSLFSILKDGTDSTKYINNVENVISDGNRIYAIISHTFYYSDDNGLSWTQNNNGLINGVYPNSLALEGNTVYVSTNHGLYSSNKTAINWNMVPGAAMENTNSLHTEAGILFMSVPGVLIKSTDHGATWTKLYQGLYDYNGWGTTGLAGTPDFNIVISNNHYYRNVSPAGFEEFEQPIPSFQWGAFRIYDKVFTGNYYTSNGINWTHYDGGLYSNGESMAAHHGKLFKSGSSNSDSILRADTAGILSWTPVNTPPDIIIRNISADENAIYVQALNYITSDTLLYVSFDEAVTWSQHTLPTFGQLTSYDGKLILSSLVHSYISDDGGNSWTDTFNGLPGNRIKEIINHNDTLFCLGLSAEVNWPHYLHWEIYRYDRDSVKWFNSSINIHDHVSDSYYYYNAALYSDNKNLYLSATNWGLWQLTYDLYTGVSSEPKHGRNFVLFPNPSNGTFKVKIDDDIIAGQFHKLNIYNITGMLLRQFSADESTIDLNDLPKGMYFISLVDSKSGQNSCTQRVIIQ
jgi:hypothetical protein